MSVIPMLFGHDVAKLFGVWIGIAAGLLAWLLSAAIMVCVWHLCDWIVARRAKGTRDRKR